MKETKKNKEKNDKKGKVFVTGGSGFLGINLIRELLKQGYDIVNYDIEKFTYEDCVDKIETHVADIRDKDSLLKTMKGCDYVVHCAAALPLYKKKDIFSTDIDGTRNVVDVAHHYKINRFVQISSTAVYGIPDHHPLVETDKLDGVGPYGIAKIEAEKVCTDYREKGMTISIIRPKSFIGPERLGAFAMFYDWAKDGHGFPMIGSGNNKYQFLDVADLCDAIILCMTLDKEKTNDVFNIGAREFTTMKEDYQAVLDYAGFKKKIKGFPAGPVIFGLRILEFLHLSPLYKWVYETASKDSFVSIEKAENVLGFNPKYSNKDALLRNYKWYVANLSKFENKTGVSHRVPWNQGILKIVKKFF